MSIYFVYLEAPRVQQYCRRVSRVLRILHTWTTAVGVSYSEYYTCDTMSQMPFSALLYFEVLRTYDMCYIDTEYDACRYDHTCEPQGEILWLKQKLNSFKKKRGKEGTKKSMLSYE